MFFKTTSTGVRRLSLIGGLIAGIYYQYVKVEPFGPPAQTPGRPWHNLFINLSNIALEFTLCFLAAWLIIRVIAWIIAGFIHDRSNK